MIVKRPCVFAQALTHIPSVHISSPSHICSVQAEDKVLYQTHKLQRVPARVPELIRSPPALSSDSYIMFYLVTGGLMYDSERLFRTWVEPCFS